MVKSKKGLGTYSNDGLGSEIKFSEENMIKARAIVEADLKNIKSDFIEQLYRLEEFIKKNGNPIPRIEDFSNWFFDKKKIYQTGLQLPKITDLEILEYVKEYNQHLKNLLKSQNELINNEGLKSIKWIKNEEKLKNLYDLLISNDFISPNITFENFNNIFSGTDLSLIIEKIVWLKIAKNKKTNKKSISDFVNILMKHNCIDQISGNITKILSCSFASAKEELVFTNSNLAKDGDFSEFVNDFDKIIKSL